MSGPIPGYPSPLAGYEGLPPLPDERNEDGKSFKNPQTGVLSTAYERFPEPLDNGRRGGLYVHLVPSTPLGTEQTFGTDNRTTSDVHVYYFQNNPQRKKPPFFFPSFPFSFSLGILY
jgi:hypothetical protein